MDKEKEAELVQAFNLYCIFNPETGHFDKDNNGTVPTPLLRNVVRAVGMCPTEQDLEKFEAGIGGDTFNMDQARATVLELLKKVDDEEDIITAYKTMAEEDPEGMINKDRLWQKMKRRLGTDKATDQMIADANPGPDGMIEYASFIKRQFEVRGLTIRLPKMEADPTLEAVKAMLKEKYGDENGPAYPYKYKTGEELSKELSGHGEETRKFLAFGREQQGVLKEAISYETNEKVVEAKLEELKTEKNPFKAAVILRELDSFYTGHKYLQQLEDMDMPCLTSVDEIKDEKEHANAVAMIPKLEAMKKGIQNKWRTFQKK